MNITGAVHLRNSIVNEMNLFCPFTLLLITKQFLVIWSLIVALESPEHYTFYVAVNAVTDDCWIK